MIPATTSAVPQLYDAARTAMVCFRRVDRGRLAVTGRDRAGFLHALFTNDIAALTPGRGCYTAYLTPQGRMISDFLVYELGDRILLVLDRSLAGAMAARLDQLIFSEDVQVADLTETTGSLVVAGPASATLVAAIVDGVPFDDLSGLPEHGTLPGQFAGESATIARVSDTGEPGYEVVVAAGRRETLEEAVTSRGVPIAGDDLAETLRIEAGIPKFLRDMDTDTIPLEAGLESRAISMTKGCYVGQEVIVRVLHRGHGRVAEKLVMLEIDGSSVPAAGTEVHVDERKVGRVTSSTFSIALGRPIALAYLHRDFTAPATKVRVGESTAVVRDKPVTRSL